MRGMTIEEKARSRPEHPYKDKPPRPTLWRSRVRLPDEHWLHHHHGTLTLEEWWDLRRQGIR